MGFSWLVSNCFILIPINISLDFARTTSPPMGNHLLPPFSKIQKEVHTVGGFPHGIPNLKSLRNNGDAWGILPTFAVFVPFFNESRNRGFPIRPLKCLFKASTVAPLVSNICWNLGSWLWWISSMRNFRKNMKKHQYTVDGCEILHQLKTVVYPIMGCNPPRWCRISSIHSIIWALDDLITKKCELAINQRGFHKWVWLNMLRKYVHCGPYSEPSHSCVPNGKKPNTLGGLVEK